MKKSIFLILTTWLSMSVMAQYPDLPDASPNFHLQNMPTGSYIIAMDNQNQGSGSGIFTTIINNRAFNWTSGNPVITAVLNTTGITVGMYVTGHANIPAGTQVTAVTATTVTLSAAPTGSQNNKSIDFGTIAYSGADFNLRAYGLLVTLLNNGVKLKWIIKPHKVKDAIDFSVNASRVKPSAGAAANMDFAAGPFVIFQQDTAGVAAIVQAFNGAASSDDVKLYKSNADVMVDIRYDYFFNGSVWKPKACIMSDGGNEHIHEAYMINAGVPTSNYAISASPGLVIDCYTFASEPHNTVAPNSVISQIATFVNFGGNFLAECAAVRTYELSALARFQSTNGFDNANENGKPAVVNYSNSDLGYFQINGYFGIADEGGSLQSWVIPEAPANPPKNHFHYHTSGTDNARNYTNASASKLVSTTGLGGMVFYLGSHSYDGNNDYDINGQRMYLNAFLMPTNPQSSLQSAAVVVCPSTPNTPTKVNVGSGAGPAAAYPLTFTLYKDNAPAGYGPEDQQQGNVVTMTAPNTYQNGVNQITGVVPAAFTNYVVAIRPALACFTPKYIMQACSPVLAVNYLSFTAKRNNSVVDLQWSTSGEQNNKGYYVERLVGNGTWETVGFVTSLAPGGNSSDALNYSFTDMNYTKSVTQYRLRQVNFDNTAKLSEIRTVKGIDQKSGMVVYPNPSSGTVNLVFDDVSSKDIGVIDMSGRMVKLLKGVTTNSVRIENLTAGVYTIKVVETATGEQSVEKVVVNK